MKKPLIAFFVTVSISLVIVLCWAGSHQSLWDYLSHHGRNPWYIATILDCYWGFLIFYLWVIYKEYSWLTRIPWLVGIICLGNIAVATYAMTKLLKLPDNASFEDFLLKQNFSSSDPI